MSITERELSLKIYKYLCNIIGTEEVVKTRRKIFCSYDSATRLQQFTTISSGSKAEGLDLKGSDYDQMFVLKDFQVYENTSKISSLTNKKPIIMDISDTKPGFTKLKLYNILHSYPHHIKECVEIVEGETYISSKLFRENYLPDGFIIHGPCISTQDGTYDGARCFGCKEWITPVHQWVFRSRSSWPDHRLVMSVIRDGVLFVSIGCRGSVNEDLEWRISFSMAEKQLIFSFTHTQLLCYALMKIILNDIIKKKHSDLICSYFLKTIMFWLCEESDPSEWHPGNMVPCFINCIKRLIYCVQYKTCLHYFIPKYNLFEGRFTDYQHKGLLKSLHDIYNALWPSVFQTALFQRFINEQRISPSSELTASALSCLVYPVALLFLKNPTSPLININDIKLYTYMMALVCNIWMQFPDRIYSFEGRNKSLYRQYRINLHFFKAGLYANAVSAWSLLASLFYKQKRFHECIEILNYSVSKCTTDKIMLWLDKNFAEQTFFQTVNEAFGLSLTCKHLIINDVTFSKPFNLLPVELTTLINFDVCNTGICIIPSVVYLNMLSFLCCHHLGDKRGKLNAIRDLELTIRNRLFINRLERNVKLANNCFQIAKSMM